MCAYSSVTRAVALQTTPVQPVHGSVPLIQPEKLAGRAAKLCARTSRAWAAHEQSRSVSAAGRHHSTARGAQVAVVRTISAVGASGRDRSRGGASSQEWADSQEQHCKQCRARLAATAACSHGVCKPACKPGL